MKMVDMKESEKERELGVPVLGGDNEETKRPRYPYELQICIKNEKVDKLGLGKCGAGDKVRLICWGEVSEVSEMDDNWGISKRVRIQIQKVGNEEDEGEGTAFESRK
jgi:hypothetical protein